jgi:Domain of unknown function (DUF4396)
MSLSYLSFLADPWFVVPWYGFGALAAAWVLRDTLVVNTHVNAPLKAGWPVILLFFSVLGLVVYLWTCRPRRIGRMTAEAAARAHHAYVDNTFKKVTGSVIHCVAGDGLGIISAMVVLRLLKVSFWTEFWVEYAVGFAFGWFVFQYPAMRGMVDSPWMALWMGGRAEFFSMISLMFGMGVVMCCVTPTVVAEPPRPDTAVFWGFGAFALLVGTVLTYPMNWWLVRIGWKHGMA